MRFLQKNCKESIAVGIMRRIRPVLFLLVNFCLIWVSIKIAYFVVGVSRLDERKGYEITDAEELAFFLFFTISMVLFQLVNLFFISRYFKKKRYQKPILLVNIVAHFLLILWFIFSVYQFTINGV